jgi:HEAT repeat protein
MSWFSRKPNIEKIKNKKDVDALLKLLASSDIGIMCDVIYALGEVGDKRVLDSFQSLIKHDRTLIRNATAIALKNFKNEPRAVALLLTATNDKDEETIYHAIRSLKQVGDYSALKDVYLVNRKTRHIQIKNESEISLLNIYERLNTEEIISLLGSDDNTTRDAIIHVIGLLVWKDPTHFNILPLIKGLKDSNPQARISSAIALKTVFTGDYEYCRPHWDDREAIQTLILLLKDNNANVRGVAIDALSSCKDEQMIDHLTMIHHLVAALKDSDPFVRFKATSGLGNFHEKMVIEPLISQLDDSEGLIRRSACGSLGQLLDNSAIIPLCRMITDPDKNVISDARLALIEFRNRADNIDREKTNEILSNALISEKSESRFAAADLIKYYGTKSKQSATLLCDALTDNSDDVMKKECLIKALEKFDEDPQIYDAIITSLYAPHDAVRRAAVEFLIDKGHPDAIIHLQKIINDDEEDRNLQQSAKIAIDKINIRKGVVAY